MKDATQIQERFLNPIEAKIRACISQLRSAKGCLVSHNYIVQIGEAMTVTRTDGKADIEVTNYPSQWCEKGVKQIKAIGWENHLGEILEANVYNYKDWYKKELKTALDSRRLIRESFSAK